MSDAPERIWLSHAGSAREYDVPISLAHKPIDYPGSVQEYIRADIAPTDAQVMAHPKVRALVETLREVADPMRVPSYGDPVVLREYAVAALRDMEDGNG